MEAVLFHADRRTDGRTDMTKLIVASRNFAKASSNRMVHGEACRRVETLIVATIYLQLIQNRYMLRSFTVLQCSHQHCVQPVSSDVEDVGYL